MEIIDVIGRPACHPARVQMLQAVERIKESKRSMGEHEPPIRQLEGPDMLIWRQDPSALPQAPQAPGQPAE